MAAYLLIAIRGIVLKRYSQSVSTGYEMLNGRVYTATRRTAITEVSTKKIAGF